MKFQIGETYYSDKYPKDEDIFILGIAEETDDGVWLAILFINPITKANNGEDELFIHKDDFNIWKKRDL